MGTKRWAIVGPGGGAAACEQVGAFRAFFEHALVPSFMVGTSAGALNVAVVCHHKNTLALERMWGEIRSESDVFAGKFWVQFPWSTGAKTTAPLEKKLHAILDGHRPQIPFWVAVSEFKKKRLKLVSQSDGDLFNMVVASARIPGYVEAYRPSPDVCYADGGVMMNNGVPAAIQGGAEVVVVLHTRMQDASIGDRWEPGNPLEMLVRGFEICDEVLYSDQGATECSVGPKIIDLWAGANDIEALDFSPKLISRGVSRGYERALLRLSEVEAAISF